MDDQMTNSITVEDSTEHNILVQNSQEKKMQTQPSLTAQQAFEKSEPQSQPQSHLEAQSEVQSPSNVMSNEPSNTENEADTEQDICKTIHSPQDHGGASTVAQKTDQNTSDPEPLHGVVTIGNPGSGKSTILNGLAGDPVFRSGLSYGCGLTVDMQEHVVNSVSYFDTPGLDDIDMREKAGAEIDKVLSRNQDLKLVFVVTEINGRVNPADATTISLVLEAVEGGRLEKNCEQLCLDDRFAVVINQASKSFIDKMRSDPKVEQLVRSKLIGDRSTKHWVYVEQDPEFISKENGVLKNEQLAQHVCDMPITKGKGEKVLPIDVQSFSERLEQAVKMFKEKENDLEQELEKKKSLVEDQEQSTRETQQMLDTERKQKEEMEQELANMEATLNEQRQKRMDLQNQNEKYKQELQREKEEHDRKKLAYQQSFQSMYENHQEQKQQMQQKLNILEVQAENESKQKSNNPINKLKSAIGKLFNRCDSISNDQNNGASSSTTSEKDVQSYCTFFLDY